MSVVGNCARCGLDHHGIRWEMLHRPVVDDDGTTWTHWAPCPANGQPILCRMESTTTVTVRYRWVLPWPRLRRFLRLGDA